MFMKTIPDGFVLCPDEIAMKHGLYAAAVYGLVYRFENMEDGVCWASQKTLAEMLDISDRVVRKHLKVLLENGYISEKKRKGVSSLYNTTNKLVLNISVRPGDTAALYSEGSAQNSAPPRHDIPTNRVVNRELNKDLEASFSEKLTPIQRRELEARKRLLAENGLV